MRLKEGIEINKGLSALGNAPAADPFWTTGHASSATLAWLRERGERLLGDASTVPAATLLLLGTARSRAASLEALQLSLHAPTNDRLVAALEEDAPSSEPVDEAELGGALIAYNNVLPLILLRDGAVPPTEACWSSNDVERFCALNLLFGTSLIDRTGPPILNRPKTG